MSPPAHLASGRRGRRAVSRRAGHERGSRGLGGAGCQGAEGEGRGEPDLGDARGDRRGAALYRGGPRRASRTSGACRACRPTPAGRGRRCTPEGRGRSASTPASRRRRSCNAFYRKALAAGQQGVSRRLRPRHPPRLRQRPRAGDRRRRQGRGGDRLGRGHEGPLRRHPARQGLGVDDDERGGDPGPRELHRRRRGAGGGAGRALGDDPERHPQGVHGPQHLHLPARAQHADRVGHHRLHGARDAEVQLDLDLRLPHAGGRARTWCRSSPSPWPTARNT